MMNVVDIELKASSRALKMTQDELTGTLNLMAELEVVAFNGSKDESEIIEQTRIAIECLLRDEDKLEDYEKIYAIYQQIDKERTDIFNSDDFQMSMFDRIHVANMVFQEDIIESTLRRFELDDDEVTNFIEEYDLRDIQHDLMGEICTKIDEAIERLKSSGDLFEELFHKAKDEGSDMWVYTLFCQLARKALHSKLVEDAAVNVSHIDQNEMQKLDGYHCSIRGLCYAAFINIKEREEKLEVGVD